MMYSVGDIAKYIIDYYSKAQNPVTNLKLQKLLYFTWVEFYKLTKNYLYNDKFEAWPLGPVAVSVYYEYCPYGSMPIDDEKYTIILDPDDKKLVDSILDRYKDVGLSNMCYT